MATLFFISRLTHIVIIAYNKLDMFAIWAKYFGASIDCCIGLRIGYGKTAKGGLEDGRATGSKKVWPHVA